MIRLGWLWPRGDGRLMVLYALLVIYSLALLWSVTEPLTGAYSEMRVDVPKSVFWRQLTWIIISWMSISVVSRVPLRYLENVSWPAYLAVVLMLAAVLAVGPEVAGATSTLSGYFSWIIRHSSTASRADRLA